MSGQLPHAATTEVATSSRKRASNPNRGAKPGERRGGRKAGTPNKTTSELKELARTYTADALEALAQIMRESESDAARVSAINSILDRGYGKPSQVIAGDEENPLRMTHRIELVPVLPK